MDKTWEEKLAEILAKEPAACTPADAEFLRARRSYLSPQQLEAYAKVLGLTADKSDADEDAGKPLEEHTLAELKNVAKDLDLNPKDFKTREDLIAAIKEKQAAQ